MSGKRCWHGVVCALVLGLWVGMGSASAADSAPIIKEIAVAGNLTVKPDDIKYHMRSREGQPLDAEVLKEDFTRVVKMGQFADVQIHREEVPGGVKLTVVVREKPVIRRVAFSGNKDVRSSKLEKTVTIKVGQDYDPGIVNKDIRAIEDLYREQYHFFVEVTSLVEPFEDGVRLTYVVNEGEKVTVRKIRFNGNTNVPAKLLLKHMETRGTCFLMSGKFDQQKFDQDMERLRLLYQSKGYLDVQITPDKPEMTDGKNWRGKPIKKIELMINIEEGQVYKLGRITFDGHTIHTDEEIRAVLKCMPGEVYNPMAISEDAKAVELLYGSTGRVFTQVRPERLLSEDGDVLDVAFHIKESGEITVDGVIVTGLKVTQERVVLREVELFPGEKFDGNKVEETKRNLNRINLFERPVKVELKESDEPDRAKVIVDAKETRTGTVSLGVGYSTADGAIGTVTLKENNFDHRAVPHSWKDLTSGHAFRGAGEKFSVELTGGTETEKAAIDFTNPYIWDKPIRFSTGIMYSNREWDDYDEMRAGMYFLLGRKVFGSKHWDLSGKYKIERVTLDNFDDGCAPEITSEEGDNWISRMVFKLAYDTRDDIFDPTSGWYAHVSQEVAGGPLAGDKDFWRTMGEINYFRTVYKDKLERPYVFSFRIEGAMAGAYGDSDEVPVYERYYAGGIGSLRGFDYHSVAPRSIIGGDEIGGETLKSGSVEFFFPIWGEAIRGSVYFDMAQVERYLDDEGWWNDDDETWRASVGGGVHIKTPLGPVPVRIYVNSPLKDIKGDDTPTVQFTFGAFF